MGKKELCAFGKNVEKKLVDIGKPQNWLIGAVREDTGKFFDRSFLYKIETGVSKSHEKIASICKILEIDPPA